MRNEKGQFAKGIYQGYGFKKGRIVSEKEREI